MDNLTICKRCGSDACYTQEVTPKIINYFCYGCGFQTNTLMKEGEEFFKQQKELLPELYKDLIYKDEEESFSLSLWWWCFREGFSGFLHDHMLSHVSDIVSIKQMPVITVKITINQYVGP